MHEDLGFKRPGIFFIITVASHPAFRASLAVPCPSYSLVGGVRPVPTSQLLQHSFAGGNSVFVE